MDVMKSNCCQAFVFFLPPCDLVRKLFLLECNEMFSTAVVHEQNLIIKDSVILSYSVLISFERKLDL